MSKGFKYSALLIGFALGIGLGLLWAGEASYRVVVNSENPISSLSRDQASKLFLKKVRTWEHGVTVLPVDLVGSSPVREEFTREIHGKSVSAVKNYWQQQIFSGRNTPPPEKTSDGDVISYVKSSPGAIGYVSGKADVKEVKVVRIEE